MRRSVAERGDRFAVIVPSIPGYRHTSAFREVADAVVAGLSALGCDVVPSNTWDGHDRRMIVFGGHLRERPDLPQRSILYNLEQVSVLTAGVVAAMRPYTIWDYSRANVNRWKEFGVDAKHVPIGYVPELTRIRPVDTPELDVLFYGTTSPRRRRVVDALERSGLNVLAFDRLYGEMRDGIMARTKVVLNVGCYDEHRVFEAVRVAYALANKLCVVSENGHDDEDFREAALIVPYDEIVETCIRAVADPRLRRDRAERGLALMRSRPQTEILRQVLS